eukprot:5542639-Pleurochrysis_carterae.AAC.1
MGPTHQTGTHEPEIRQAVHAFCECPLSFVRVPRATALPSQEGCCSDQLCSDVGGDGGKDGGHARAGVDEF